MLQLKLLVEKEKLKFHRYFNQNDNSVLFLYLII